MVVTAEQTLYGAAVKYDNFRNILRKSTILYCSHGFISPIQDVKFANAGRALYSSLGVNGMKVLNLLKQSCVPKLKGCFAIPLREANLKACSYPRLRLLLKLPLYK